jgi:hypothetical protein
MKMNHLPAPKKQTQNKANFFKGQNELRAYPNNRVVMRPSEKFEAKAAGQKCSEAWFSPRREHFWPTTQASGFAAGRNRTGYLDRLLTSLAKKSGHTLLWIYLNLFLTPPGQTVRVPPSDLNLLYYH